MKKWSILILLSLAQFIMVLDSTVMNVSISEVVADLHTSVVGLQSAITFYTLTMAALMLTGGKMGDKMGRLRAFKIGAVIYALGSFITAISPNLATLMIGWSVIEGLGAVLVIPAIAALLAASYVAKDRVIGFAVIGGVSGAAAAAGPLIGGFMTTYFSWRYVFLAETVVVAIILLSARSMKASKPTKQIPPLDIPSVLLSVFGMVSLVFGLLQSKVWGWVEPMTKPVIAGHEIAPLGISIVAYLIALGIFILYVFYRRQQKLELERKNPLLQVSMLSSTQLKSGLAVLGSQYLITAAVFFVIPVYLQMVLGLDALQTGIRILPLSVALITASVLGAKLATKYSPKQIVRIGQVLLVLGGFLLVGAIDPELKSFLFGAGMFLLGAGLGFLASQLGNVNMSAVPDKQSSEAGGLQGTMQNLGSSFGTALIGSVLIATLTTGFINNADANAEIPANVQQQIQKASTTGVPIVSTDDVQTYAMQNGLSTSQADAVASSYEQAQIKGLKTSMVFLVGIGLVSLPLSRRIPNRKMG